MSFLVCSQIWSILLSHGSWRCIFLQLVLWKNRIWVFWCCCSANRPGWCRRGSTVKFRWRLLWYLLYLFLHCPSRELYVCPWNIFCHLGTRLKGRHRLFLEYLMLCRWMFWGLFFFVRLRWLLHCELKMNLIQNQWSHNWELYRLLPMQGFHREKCPLGLGFWLGLSQIQILWCRGWFLPLLNQTRMKGWNPRM